MRGNYRVIARKLSRGESYLGAAESALKEAIKCYGEAKDKSDNEYTLKRCDLVVNQVNSILKQLTVIDNAKE